MVPDNVRKEILKRIKSTEQKHNVRVLYAIESGSRAWGFASTNSDYDVRFIYAHPKDWYLSINVEGRRDVIEYDIVDEIDINGWDVRKALKLFWRSNPAFVEWLQSPIVYIDDGLFARRARALMAGVYSVEKGIYHYRSMAKTNYRGYLKSPTVPFKKYFYVLRPLLSVLWLEKHQSPAPIEFDRLKQLVAHDQALLHEIDKLLALKKSGGEKDSGPAIPAISHFIEQELARLDSFQERPLVSEHEVAVLDDLFLQSLIGD